MVTGRSGCVGERGPAVDERWGGCGEQVDPRIQEFRVRLALSGPTEAQAEAVAEAFRTRCPVYTTLSRAAPIELEVAVDPRPPVYSKEQSATGKRNADG